MFFSFSWKTYFLVFVTSYFCLTIIFDKVLSLPILLLQIFAEAIMEQ